MTALGAGLAVLIHFLGTGNLTWTNTEADGALIVVMPILGAMIGLVLAGEIMGPGRKQRSRTTVEIGKSIIDFEPFAHQHSGSPRVA